jgi:putative Holliday junction resolvase
LVSNGRILALDVGDKTIGVAVSDELGIIARGLFTLKRISEKKDIRKILETIAEQGAGAVVVGLPLNLNGSDSVQTQKVRAFADDLTDALRGRGRADIGVKLHDERFTTKIAEQALIDANVRRAKRKTLIDKQAAVVILQSYLDCAVGR